MVELEVGLTSVDEYVADVSLLVIVVEEDKESVVDDWLLMVESEADDSDEADPVEVTVVDMSPLLLPEIEVEVETVEVL
jgi:hypothetical protein